MKSKYLDVIIGAVCLPIGIAIAYFSLPRHGVIVYNCSIAEISPDYPVSVKEECRKLNAGKK